MERKVFNKLVRDNIPDIIKANGEYYMIEILDDSSYEEKLNDKFYEELEEILKAKSKEELTEELADLMEVMLAKASLHDITFGDINKIRITKAREKGGFDKKILLKFTADKKYIDTTRGCITCDNNECPYPLSEEYDYDKNGKPVGYYCIKYKSGYNSKKPL